MTGEDEEEDEEARGAPIRPTSRPEPGSFLGAEAETGPDGRGGTVTALGLKPPRGRVEAGCWWWRQGVSDGGRVLVMEAGC